MGGMEEGAIRPPYRCLSGRVGSLFSASILGHLASRVRLDLPAGPMTRVEVNPTASRVASRYGKRLRSIRVRTLTESGSAKPFGQKKEPILLGTGSSLPHVLPLVSLSIVDPVRSIGINIFKRSCLQVNAFHL